MTLYVENFKDSTKILAQINKFSQVKGYKVNIQISVALFHIIRMNHPKSDREKVKGQNRWLNN